MIHVYGPQRDRLAQTLQLFQVGVRIRPVWNAAQVPDTPIMFAMIANDPNEPPRDILDKLRAKGAAIVIVSLQYALQNSQREAELERAVRMAGPQ